MPKHFEFIYNPYNGLDTEPDSDESELPTPSEGFVPIQYYIGLNASSKLPCRLETAAADFSTCCSFLVLSLPRAVIRLGLPRVTWCQGQARWPMRSLLTRVVVCSHTLGVGLVFLLVKLYLSVGSLVRTG